MLGCSVELILGLPPYLLGKCTVIGPGARA